MNLNQTILYDFIQKHPFAASQTLDKLPSEEVATFVQTLPLESSLRLLSLMNIKNSAACFVLLSTSKKTDIIEKGAIHFVISLLKLIEISSRNNLLEKITTSKKNNILRKMQYDDNTVGALMETAISVYKEMLVEEAVQLIKRNSNKEEFYLYVIDLNGKLIGFVRLKELLLADKSDILQTLMSTESPKIFPEIEIKSILNNDAWFNYRQLPVVDKSDKLLGTLTYKATMEVFKNLDDFSTNEISETGSALGELYKIGLTGLLQSISK